MRLLIVSLLTFVIGSAVASLWLVSHRPSRVSIKLGGEVMAATPSPSPAKPKRTYESVMAGEGSMGSSPGASFVSFKSSDGMRFTKWTTDYESPKRANSVLEEKLSTAVKIISRAPVLDKNKKQIGEIVVATFAADNHDAGPASLIWTEDSTLCQVDSSSVENILEYRKDFHH